MNVIIANKQKDKLNDLNIEVIKRLDGCFEADEIIATFQNMFYNKMILDVTALKNSEDINTFQKLSISLGMDKMILLLEPGTAMTQPSFLSKLISVGIYNFTTASEGVSYLYDNPNTYRDVAQYHNIVEPVVQTPQPVQNVTETVAVPVAPTPIPTDTKSSFKVLGIKSVTQDAGATTLAYMIKNVLAKTHNVLCVEVDKTDFNYFKGKDLVSTTSSDIGNIINQNKDKDLIVVDVNGSTSAIGLCNEMIYLVEPSTIKLNKLVTIRPATLKELKGRKVVLNKSPLNKKDINDFEYEANLDVFFNLPMLDERKNNEEVVSLLKKLGII